MIDSDFQPKWVSAPGDTILDILEERKISLYNFAEMIDYSFEELNSLIYGKSSITLATARKLQEKLGASTQFWLSRDFQYWKDTERKSNEEWIKSLPVEDMMKFGWINSISSPADLSLECLKFFCVSDIGMWKQNYEGIFQSVSFKKSQAYDTQPGSVSVWLRRCEILANEIHCKPWNKDLFQSSIEEIRKLLHLRYPSKFFPKLRDICAECGVALIVERTPSGCPVSGATRFLTQEKAVLLLSLRYKTEDQFWFSFFHEAGHLLLHGENKLFLEIADSFVLDEEDEANIFAENIIIPNEYKQELMDIPLNQTAIFSFARKIRATPGIVVGQLQHFGKIPPNYFNKMKLNFDWSEFKNSIP